MTDLGFSARAVTEPNKPAFVQGDRQLTFGELDQRTDRLATALEERGVESSDPIAVMLPNGFEFFEADLAAGKLEARSLTLNWHLKDAEVGYILEDSAAKALVTTAELAARLPGAMSRTRQRGATVLVVDGGGDEDYEATLAAQVEAAHRETVTTGSPMVYTSGTTGRPKGVVHDYVATQEMLRIGMDGQVELWDWNSHDVHLLAGPAYHAGPGGWTMVALYAGATTVILPSWDAREWMRCVEQHHGTRGFMVPSHFIRVLEVPEEERARFDLSSLELIVHAGAPCPPSVKRRMLEAFPDVEIAELYGMSEGGATVISRAEWLERPGSVGKPWRGVKVAVRDEDGNELPVGEPGLIYVSPAYGIGFHYHNDEEKTAGAWQDDAFTVGDVGYLDEDGYLHLIDRASDMIIRGGVNIYPREIEDMLHTHPDVVDCVVFGIPDERYGEQVKAVVESRESVDPGELARYIEKDLADFKVPRVFEIVETLPREPNGKVMKRLLRDQHWVGQSAVGTVSELR